MLRWISERTMMRRAALLFLLTTLLAPVAPCVEREEIPYSSPAVPWPVGLGNHRAVVHVSGARGIARVRIPWRRTDASPEKKRISIVDSASGAGVRNIHRLSVTEDDGDLLFEAGGGERTYYIYYLPYKVQMEGGWYSGDYLAAEEPAEREWLREHGRDGTLDLRGRPDIPEGRVSGFQSRTPFDSFYPMEVPATRSEEAAFLSVRGGGMLLFAEDRAHPIKMRDRLPHRWLVRGPDSAFSGRALRNEYYAFQIGVVPLVPSLDSIEAIFEPLAGPGDRHIGPERTTCFNLGGIDARGHAFLKRVDIPRGRVQPLWMGIDLPPDITPGIYRGGLRIRSRSGGEKRIRLTLQVVDSLLADRGDGETWRHSRLRWLNSRRGSEPTVVPPYAPVARTGPSLRVLGRELKVDSSGLPAQILSGSRALLASPIHLVLERKGGARSGEGGSGGGTPTILRRQSGEPLFSASGGAEVNWLGSLTGEGITVRTTGIFAFDGYARFRLRISSEIPLPLADCRLEIPFRSDRVPLMMGIGLAGGKTPERYEWGWTGPYDSFWAGDAGGGLHCEFRGGSYNGPMLNLYHPSPPASWGNDGKGSISVEKREGVLAVVAKTGPRTLQAGEELILEFALLVTPVKPINTYSQFHDRYYHSIAPMAEDLAAGIRVLNLHHGNGVNPYINYPFLTVDTLRGFVRRWHQAGLKVKLYNTVRELSNAVTELWALRSLGAEVLADGPGGGYPWLREHLRDGYAWAWYNPFPDSSADAAVVTAGESRWYNYYIEGLAWLVGAIGIDGLYLDDVTYDREILLRMKRVLRAAGSDAILDLHSNTGFSIGPANQYAEFFPFIDKLWFGESFKYDAMSPEEWLVTCSGIPFGLMGDMLQGGGNPWRGMVYGMTVRQPWVTDGVVCDPRPIWKVWNEVGIERMRMIGYWDPGCPVRTGRNDVLATAFVGKKRALIAVGSWAKERVTVRLAIDFRQLGIDPSRARFRMPAIAAFQPGREFGGDPVIQVEPGRGFLLIMDERN
jgi:hypothetical protein